MLTFIVWLFSFLLAVEWLVMRLRRQAFTRRSLLSSVFYAAVTTLVVAYFVPPVD